MNVEPGPATESLQAKGMVLLSVIAALKAHPRYRARVPGRLAHYLNDPILVSSWYPFQDYIDLLDVLAGTADEKVVGANPYRFFGRVAFQRDLKGSQDQIPEKQRTAMSGVYSRALASARGLAERIRESLRIRQYYYSAGSYRVRRTAERVLRIHSVVFPFVSANVCALTTGYLEGVFGEPAFKARVVKVSCRGAGQQHCAWDATFDPAVDVTDLALFQSEGGISI